MKECPKTRHLGFHAKEHIRGERRKEFAPNDRSRRAVLQKLITTRVGSCALIPSVYHNRRMSDKTTARTA